MVAGDHVAGLRVLGFDLPAIRSQHKAHLVALGLRRLAVLQCRQRFRHRTRIAGLQVDAARMQNAADVELVGCTLAQSFRARLGSVEAFLKGIGNLRRVIGQISQIADGLLYPDSVHECRSGMVALGKSIV